LYTSSLQENVVENTTVHFYMGNAIFIEMMTSRVPILPN